MNRLKYSLLICLGLVFTSGSASNQLKPKCDCQNWKTYWHNHQQAADSRKNIHKRWKAYYKNCQAQCDSINKRNK